jgi:hypothetical protein
VLRIFAHGLIAKILHKRRWQVTNFGRQEMSNSLCRRDAHFFNRAFWRRGLVIVAKGREVREKESIHKFGCDRHGGGPSPRAPDRQRRLRAGPLVQCTRPGAGKKKRPGIAWSSGSLRDGF